MHLSLRLSLTLAIAAILAGTLAISGALTYRHAANKLDVEIESAMAAARRTIEREFANLPRGKDVGSEIAAIVRSFDDNRHISVAHQLDGGDAVTRSTPAPPVTTMPDWFYRQIAPPERTATIAFPPEVAAPGSLIIHAEPRNEAGEVWGDLRLHLATLAIFCALVFAILSALIGYALAPLGTLLDAFERIGYGRAGATVPEAGPLELVKLAGGFNRMSRMLAEIDERNRQLDRQLETVQEEERMSLARDLHDDIGPLLFSIDVDATTIREALRGQEESDIARRAASISEVVADVKEQVRLILWQLRPGVVLDLGLANAIENLAAFWKAKHPEVEFEVDVGPQKWSPPTEFTLFAIVREALNNALRHGRPRRIAIHISENAGREIVATITNDGGALGKSILKGGLGLIGMRERAELAGGSLEVADTDDGAGVKVEARLPLSADRGPEAGGSQAEMAWREEA